MKYLKNESFFFVIISEFILHHKICLWMICCNIQFKYIVINCVIYYKTISDSLSKYRQIYTKNYLLEVLFSITIIRCRNSFVWTDENFWKLIITCTEILNGYEGLKRKWNFFRLCIKWHSARDKIIFLLRCRGARLRRWCM